MRKLVLPCMIDRYPLFQQGNPFSYQSDIQRGPAYTTIRENIPASRGPDFKAARVPCVKESIYY